MSDYVFFLLSTREQQGGANRQDSWGFFKDAQGFGRLDAGSRVGFTSSRPPPPWTSVFQIPYFCTLCGLEKLGLVDQNQLERNLSALSLRTLVWVGDYNPSPSRSRLLSIWSKEV